MLLLFASRLFIDAVDASRAACDLAEPRTVLACPECSWKLQRAPVRQVRQGIRLPRRHPFRGKM